MSWQPWFGRWPAQLVFTPTPSMRHAEIDVRRPAVPGGVYDSTSGTVVPTKTVTVQTSTRAFKMPDRV